MRIIIFELNRDMYEVLTDYFSSSWCEMIDDDMSNGVVDVRLSNYTKLATVGSGIILDHMGRSTLLDRADYNYIKIE